MNERGISKKTLEHYAEGLYAASGKISLYIGLYCKSNRLNTAALKAELQMIKKLTEGIELELDEG